MGYLVAYESKPEAGFQVRRGGCQYMSAKQAIKAAQKKAAENFNASAMQTTATGNLVAVLWSTNPELITKPTCDVCKGVGTIQDAYDIKTTLACPYCKPDAITRITH